METARDEAEMLERLRAGDEAVGQLLDGQGVDPVAAELEWPGRLDPGALAPAAR